MPAFCESCFRVLHVLRGGFDRRVALLHAAHVLRAAVVGLQTGEAQLVLSAISFARATTASPGSTPQRRMPTSSSM